MFYLLFLYNRRNTEIFYRFQEVLVLLLKRLAKKIRLIIEVQIKFVRRPEPSRVASLRARGAKKIKYQIVEH